MAVFDESKVINALHTDKAEIGKLYYFADDMFNLKLAVKNSVPRKLIQIVGISDPFEAGEDIEGQYSFCLIYPYEEPEKKLVPFTWEDREQLRGKWIIDKKDTDTEYQIWEIEKEKLYTYVCFGNRCIDTNDLLEDYTFLDGSPCGKVVEE